MLRNLYMYVVYMYVSMYVCMYVCMYVYVCNLTILIPHLQSNFTPTLELLYSLRSTFYSSFGVTVTPKIDLKFWSKK